MTPLRTRLNERATREWGEREAFAMLRSIPQYLGNANLFLDQIQIQPDDVVVDVGCGIGLSTHAIFDRSPKKVYGVEPSASLIEVAREGFRLRNIELHQAPAEVLSHVLPERIATKVSSFHAFQYFKDAALATQEIAKVLVPDGTFWFDVYHTCNGFTPEEVDLLKGIPSERPTRGLQYHSREAMREFLRVFRTVEEVICQPDVVHRKHVGDVVLYKATK